MVGHPLLERGLVLGLGLLCEQAILHEGVGALAHFRGEGVWAVGVFDLEAVGVSEEAVDRAGGPGDGIDAPPSEVGVAGGGDEEASAGGDGADEFVEIEGNAFRLEGDGAERRKVA